MERRSSNIKFARHNKHSVRILCVLLVVSQPGHICLHFTGCKIWLEILHADLIQTITMTSCWNFCCGVFSSWDDKEGCFCAVCRPRSHSVKLVAIICVDVGECWIMCSLIYCPAFCSQLSRRGETLQAAVSVHVQQRPCLLRQCLLETEDEHFKLFHSFWQTATFIYALLQAHHLG